MLLADWFGRLASEAGLSLSQYGRRGDAFTLGSPEGLRVEAKCIEEAPYLHFVSSVEEGHDDRRALVGRIASQAAERVAVPDFGGQVWYSTQLNEVRLGLSTPQFLGPFLERLGNQTRIVGWLRLGTAVLLEFTEEASDSEEVGRLFAPRAAVDVHVLVPGPRPGHFSSHLAHPLVEAAACICTFALGRPVALPQTVFPSSDVDVLELTRKRQDSKIHTLARKGISLDVFKWIRQERGVGIFERLRSALLTFDAATKEDHHAVASILYVVAAECLTTPNAPWRTERLTKRFQEFYDELMPDAVDEIVGHANFEEAFAIRRGERTARALRRETLSRIYALRSEPLHEGLNPSYQGLNPDTSQHIRRNLIRDLAEAAILRFAQSPRSSLIGHPNSELDHEVG